MEYKEKVKYLDIIIANVENTEMFTIREFIGNKIDIKDKDSRDFELDLISFGEKYNLFKLSNPSNTSTRWLELTPKGEKLKEFKEGFIKFEESLDEKNNLEIENLKLQNESIEYSKTIRSQEQRIRNLDESLKTYEFVKKYWFLFFILLSIIYKFLEITVVYIYSNI